MAVTGAGGTRLAGGFLKKLVADDRVGHVDLLVSANGRKLLAFESDQAGPPSSGSYRFTDMIILPSALGAAARIATEPRTR